MSESPFGFLAERRVREAMARGEFDGLGWARKPLDLSDAYDPDWWIKRRLREEGNLSAIVPPAFQLRRQRDELLAGLGEFPDEPSVREAIKTFNDAVQSEYRRPSAARVPVVVLPIDADQALRRWNRARGR